MQQYTFDDWIENKFWNEKDILGRCVCNDSERYLDLVSTGKMTYKTLDEIQEAQAQVYEYMIKCTLNSYEPHLMRWKKHSPDWIRSIKSLIKRIEKKIEVNQDLYHEVVLPRLHRGMKVGAKYIIPEYYKAYKTNKPVLADTYSYAPYSVQKSLFEKGTLEDGSNIIMYFPNLLQMKYAQMEVSILWLNKLKAFVQEIEGKGTNESPYSTLQWGAIFYYADAVHSTKGKTIADKIKHFLKKHDDPTTPKKLKNDYYEARKRINEKNDFPINKLEQIIPFMKSNYSATIGKIKSDIYFLKEEKIE